MAKDNEHRVHPKKYTVVGHSSHDFSVLFKVGGLRSLIDGMADDDLLRYKTVKAKDVRLVNDMIETTEATYSQWTHLPREEEGEVDAGDEFAQHPHEAEVEDWRGNVKRAKARPYNSRPALSGFELAAQSILSDLTRRMGLRGTLMNTDAEVRADIISCIAGTIQEALAEWAEDQTDD